MFAAVVAVTLEAEVVVCKLAALAVCNRVVDGIQKAFAVVVDDNLVGAAAAAVADIQVEAVAEVYTLVEADNLADYCHSPTRYRYS